RRGSSLHNAASPSCSSPISKGPAMKRFVLLLPLLLVASMACRCPKPKTVVSYVPVKMPSCHLRELPAAVPVAVGFPTPDSVLISKTDYAEMIAFVSALRDWALDAKACLEVQQP